MNSYNVYEKLYANTKTAFTIVKNDQQYSLGEYMLMKAGNKRLPAERTENTGNSIVTKSFSYVKEKLNAKNAPKKERTMKKFPLRTAASALLSAIIVSSLAISFGAFSGKNIHSEAPVIAEPETTQTEYQTSTTLEGN